MSRRLIFVVLFCTVFPSLLSAQTDGADLIHATVSWPDGTQRTGYLRWDREEATWDDLFHSGYRENPWTEFIDHEAVAKERRDQFYASHGLIKRLVYALNEDDDQGVGWRMLLIRFGDIRSIEIHDGEDDFIVTADGRRHQIGGYANDDGSDLWLYEKGQEPLEIEWNDLTSIEFSAAPAGHEPFARRLHGTVETTEGDFTGPIMWDKSECLDIDSLDGENDEGDISLSMGEILSIRKIDNRSVRIELKNGTGFDMSGSNDVNSDNRGIWILTQDLGWVDVPWKRFIQATFSDPRGQGTPRSGFGNNTPLRGTIQLTDGSSRQGRLVYDLDEGYSWDLFNGNLRQVGYDIPFPLIAKLEPLGENTCRVHLRSGRVLELGENQDTGDKNGGMLVFSADETRAEFVSWTRIREVIFTP